MGDFSRFILFCKISNCNNIKKMLDLFEYTVMKCRWDGTSINKEINEC